MSNLERAKSAFVAAICALLGTSGAAQQPPRFAEGVEVARIIVDVRVLDDAGGPVLGLIRDDFSVRIDGRPTRVDSSAWVGGGEARQQSDLLEPLQSGSADAPLARGRLIVFVFQKSLEASRIVGLMRMLHMSRDFLGTLTPDDRIAVLSFDSHLKIWTDFTSDRARLEPVLTRGVLLERPPAIAAASPISLVERLDPARGRKAYSIEKALQLIADALEPLPGSKSIVLVGYGMGRLGFGGVSMEADYEPARRALIAARTSVFSLDVTTADYHSLEAGLQLISAQTGGFYARTHIFPDLAMRRLAGALDGYYVLFVEKPQRTRPEHNIHDIDVRLTRRRGNVFARSGFAG